jgi:hypothetical protein
MFVVYVLLYFPLLWVFIFRKELQAEKPRAPSYFSQFFESQLKAAEENGDDSHSVRTLYIDRDPMTFKDISLHLQGYYITPRDPYHFVKLFADAQFYCCKFSFSKSKLLDGSLTDNSTSFGIPTT